MAVHPRNTAGDGTLLNTSPRRIADAESQPATISKVCVHDLRPGVAVWRPSYMAGANPTAGRVEDKSRADRDESAR
jgi:hypothetical protein